MIVNRCLSVGALLLLAAAMAPLSCSGEETTAMRLVEDAVAAMGGEAYLSVKDIVSEGRYFAFNRHGDSSGLILFSDYTKLPDKSRFELGNRKKDLEITVFNLERNEGWILEGRKETREATQEEMGDFRRAVKHSLETLIRFHCKDPRNKLFYLGPGEGADIQLERVQLIDPENDEILIYFDRATRLPVKTETRRLDSRGVRLRVVREYSRWHVIQGVNTPLRIDGYINGRRSSQRFITKVTYNNSLKDDFFSRPVPYK